MDDTTNKSYKFDDFEQEDDNFDSEISNENPFPEEFDSKDVVNREEEVDENNPFGEEFSKADVVNKDSLEKKSIPPLTPEDIEKLIAYDEQKRLQRNFKTSVDLQSSGLISPETILERFNLSENELFEALSLAEDERLKSIFKESYQLDKEDAIARELYMRGHFKDFLQLPKITGQKHSEFQSNIIKSESINKKSKKIEITDDPNFKDNRHSTTSVVVNRDESGELESIEVHCKCGERTLIKFDYFDEDSGLESSSEVIKDNPGFVPFLTDAEREKVRDEYIEEQKNNEDKQSIFEEFEGENVEDDYLSEGEDDDDYYDDE
jgi:uncharacterized protein (DUF433 family)